MTDLTSKIDDYLNDGANVETIAYDATKSPEFAAIVNYVVDEMKRTDSSTSAERRDRSVSLLAWFLRYESVDPLLVIEAMLFIDNFDSLSICGTDEFEKDVLTHLNLEPKEGANRQFVPKKRDRIYVDILQGLEEPLESTDAQEDPHEISKPVPVELETSTRRIILGSMSAPEAVKKLHQNFIHGSEYAVLMTIMKLSYESKLYNRIFGNIMIQLLSPQDARWLSAFAMVIRTFLTESVQDIEEVYKLKVAGQFLGHVLSSDSNLWREVFPLLDLESSANVRIVILALLGELKACLGVASVERNILQLENIDGLTRPELAADFWELAGFNHVAENIRGS